MQPNPDAVGVDAFRRNHPGDDHDDAARGDAVSLTQIVAHKNDDAEWCSAAQRATRRKIAWKKGHTHADAVGLVMTIEWPSQTFVKETQHGP